MERVAEDPLRAEDLGWPGADLAVRALDRAFGATRPAEPAAQGLGALLGLPTGLTPRHDLSLRAGGPVARDWLRRVAPAAPLADLDGPAGLVLPSVAEVAPVADFLRAKGFAVIAAPHEGAIHDVFSPDALTPTAGLLQYLAILGQGEAGLPVSTALAFGLEARAAARVVARFRSLGLVAVHRAFQRFDLWIEGPGALTPREAADFLAARGAACVDRVGPGQRLRAERGLSHAVARQFLNDYRLIGLPAFLRLCGLDAAQKG